MDIEDNRNPDNSEKVLISLSQVVIGGVSYRTTVTGSHILLADMESGSRRGSIPLPSIGHALSTSNRLREPVIRITVNDPEGGSQEIDLIFPHIAGGADIRNRDATISVFGDLGIPVTIDPLQEALPVLTGKESRDRGTRLADDGVVDRTTVPDWTHFGVSRNTVNPNIEEPRAQSPLVTIVAVILIAALCIIAMVMPLPGPNESHAATPQLTIKTTPAAPPVSTTLPITPAESPTVIPISPTQTPIPEGSLLISDTFNATYIIPKTGVWVHVSYPGNYSGYFSSNGRWYEVNASGDQFYQMSMSHGIIDGMLEKKDGSTKSLSFEVYKDGALVNTANTSTPRGTVVAHFNI